MANKLDAAREYVLANYNNGTDFRWDVLSRKLQIKAPSDSAWQDVDTRKINSIACDCAAETGVNVTDKEIRIVLNSENIPSVNPLRDYLRHLEPYNPAEHNNHSWIDWLSAQVRIKSNLSQNRFKVCFKKWFVAMVASWLYDEVVNQEVLVLIGRQGIYKTTWLERLLPPCLRAYGTKMSNPHDLNKDEVMRIAEFGLICIDELDALNKQELNKMKSLITRSDVNERAAYAYTKERRTRVASFCGSGNESQILTDDTGNRRWLVFDVESIESPFSYDDAVFPYAQIYGEALYLLANHFNYWFDLEDIKIIEVQNESHRKKNNEEDLLPVYFEPANPGDAGAMFLSASEISQRLRDYGSIAIPMPINNLGRVMQRMGFIPRKSNGRQGYVVYAKQDIDNQRKLAARSAVDL